MGMRMMMMVMKNQQMIFVMPLLPFLSFGCLCLQQVVDSPAPGQYAHGERIGRDGAAFSMGGKRQEKPQEDLREYWLPGGSPDGPAFTMGGRPEGKEGPSHLHDMQRTIHAALPSADSHHAPCYPSADNEGDGLPGPGEYRIEPSGPSGPAFSMGGKPEAAKPSSPMPAPGAYDVAEAWKEVIP